MNSAALHQGARLAAAGRTFFESPGPEEGVSISEEGDFCTVVSESLGADDEDDLALALEDSSSLLEPLRAVIAV